MRGGAFLGSGSVFEKVVKDLALDNSRLGFPDVSDFNLLV